MSENKEITEVEVERNETQERPVFLPRYRVNESDDGFRLTVELPGVRQEDVELSVEGRSLVLRATPQPFEVPSGLRPVRREFQTGDYERTFTLPREIDADAIGASMRNGVLELVLKRSETERKVIQIS